MRGANVVLVDTGPLVALFDPADGDHELCKRELGRLRRQRLATTLAVITEATHLEGDRTAIVAMMNALRNYPPDTRIADPRDPADRTTVPPIQDLLRVAVTRRPELEAMRAMQREEESMAALARRERYPDFMTSVWYNQMLGEPDTVGMMVGASIPIFNVRSRGWVRGSSEQRSRSSHRPWKKRHGR